MEDSIAGSVPVSQEPADHVFQYFEIRGVDKNDSVLCHTNASAIMFGPSYHHAHELLHAVTTRGPLKILEIGCGCGDDSIVLSGKVNDVCAIDSDKQRVAAARKNIQDAGKATQIYVYQMDAESLGLPDDCFDLVYANSFLLWVDREAVLNECYRVAKPGGTVLFSHESMKGNPIINVYRLAGFRKRRESLVNRPTPRELAESGAQFSAFSAQYFYLISPLIYPLVRRFPTASLIQKICSVLQKIDACLLKRVPWLERFAWIGLLQYTK